MPRSATTEMISQTFTEQHGCRAHSRIANRSPCVRPRKSVELLGFLERVQQPLGFSSVQKPLKVSGGGRAQILAAFVGCLVWIFAAEHRHCASWHAFGSLLWRERNYEVIAFSNGLQDFSGSLGAG